MGVTYLGLECVEGTVGTGKLGREYVDGCVGTGTLGRESGNGGMGIGMWCLKQLNNMSYWCPIFDSCGDFAIVLGCGYYVDSWFIFVLCIKDILVFFNFYGIGSFNFGFMYF